LEDGHEREEETKKVVQGAKTLEITATMLPTQPTPTEARRRSELENLVEFLLKTIVKMQTASYSDLIDVGRPHWLQLLELLLELLR
jgi:hypothetical protein